MKTKSGSRRIREVEVYKISKWPDFMLTIFGFFASLFGQSSCDSVFYKFKARLQEIEEAEVLRHQDYLSEYWKRVVDIMENIGDKNASKVVDRNMTPRRKSGYVCKVSEIKEIINKAEADLDQRILKSRDSAESKVSAYLTGIHRGRLKTYKYPEELIGDDHARQTYKDAYNELNNKISEFLNGGV